MHFSKSLVLLVSGEVFRQFLQLSPQSDGVEHNVLGSDCHGPSSDLEPRIHFLLAGVIRVYISGLAFKTTDDPELHAFVH
jgi:hypothetical protein